MIASIKQIQGALAARGYNVGTVDGLMGRKTEAAIIAFNQANGFPANAKLTDAALKKLGILGSLSTPWLNEVGRYMGVHELRDKAKLSAWLRSDKGSVGDPTKLPWCADLTETAIKLTLPGEKFAGKLAQNPYYSLNWLEFGVKVEPCYGAIAIFVRPGGGHIGFLVGYDPVLKRYRVRGGNQSNSVCDMWLDASRLKGVRWPSSYTGPKLPLPVMNSKGAVVSTNEA